MYMLFKLADFTSLGKKNPIKASQVLYRFHVGLQLLKAHSSLFKREDFETQTPI